MPGYKLRSIYWTVPHMLASMPIAAVRGYWYDLTPAMQPVFTVSHNGNGITIGNEFCINSFRNTLIHLLRFVPVLQLKNDSINSREPPI